MAQHNVPDPSVTRQVSDAVLHELQSQVFDDAVNLAALCKCLQYTVGELLTDASIHKFLSFDQMAEIGHIVSPAGKVTRAQQIIIPQEGGWNFLMKFLLSHKYVALHTKLIESLTRLKQTHAETQDQQNESPDSNAVAHVHANTTTRPRAVQLVSPIAQVEDPVDDEDSIR